MKRIIISLSIVAAVAAVAITATTSFFSDTETSTGNTFTAGDIDLQIDNTSYVTDENGVLVASSGTSWSLRDLIVEKFFDFADLKPGDIGEDTISIHVGSNDAWMCAAAQITDDSDQTCTEPEQDDDPSCTDSNGDGELDDEINFAFWVDDGDNVLEQGEEGSIFLDGPLSGIGQQGQITLADSDDSILPNDGPIPGGDTFYIGKAWCFGNLEENPAAPGDYPQGPLTQIESTTIGTGFTCDGAPVDNAAQTDRVMGDLQFFAVQSRNNSDFTCASGYRPEWPNGESQRPFVGAKLSDYETSAQCDVIVNHNSAADDTTHSPTINGGLADAAAMGGSRTVCVENGDYNENVPIEIVGLTLHSMTGPSNTATINGDVNINADNVTLEGFDINGKVSSNFHGVTIQYNNITAPSSGSAIGFGGPAGLGSTISNNVVTNIGERGIYLDQNGTNSFVVDHNTVTARKNGFGYANSSGMVQYNIFEGYNVANGVGWEVGHDLGDTAPTISINNFNEAQGTGFAVENDHAESFDAPDNWWGDANPNDGNYNGALTASSPEASAYLQN